MYQKDPLGNNANNMKNVGGAMQTACTTDFGPEPYAVCIEKITEENCNFRRVLWTGEHLQLTLMCIGVGGDIGLEMHPDTDQFLRIEEGQGLVRMGNTRDNLDFRACVCGGSAILVPAGAWHNLTNTGCRPMKLYSIYAPPEHPYCTIHRTRAIADAEEHD
ncbi:MAG: cupin domain-containing protein [Bacillota bacterium]